jgi:hypothetical protein
MTHAKTIGRRDVLRGTGVAALAVAGAAKMQKKRTIVMYITDNVSPPA